MVKIARSAEAFIVAIDDFSLRVDQIQTIVWLVGRRQGMGAAQNHPEFEFLGGILNAEGLFAEKVPVEGG